MTFYQHPQSLCESGQVGEGTRVWAFAHILPGAKVGKNCNICDHTFIENDVIVGDNVTIKSGVQLWDGVTLEDDVFVGPNATFTNDKFPRSKVYPERFPRTVVRRGASIGANATVLPGIEIGENAMVGAGAVVTQSVPANTVVVGNPARIVRYVNTEAVTEELAESNGKAAPVQPALPEDWTSFQELPLVKDLRGNLAFGEFERHIPFVPKRYFLVYDVPNFKIRGEHAHKVCHQFLVCIRGSCNVITDDGEKRREYVLDSVEKGLYIPPMVWGVQYKYSPDAMLLVFASDYYDPDDYIRDYNAFVELKQVSLEETPARLS